MKIKDIEINKLEKLKKEFSELQKDHHDLEYMIKKLQEQLNEVKDNLKDKWEVYIKEQYESALTKIMLDQAKDIKENKRNITKLWEVLQKLLRWGKEKDDMDFKEFV